MSSTGIAPAIERNAKAAGRELTDAELGGVSGGIVSTAPANLSDQSSLNDDQKAKNLFLQQIFDVQAAILNRANLNKTIQGTAKNTKG